MILIWGIRWYAVPLGQLAYTCSRCGNKTVHTAIARKGKFTLFFVPLFPVSKKYLIQCNLCGLQLQAVGDLLQQLKELERTGRLPAAGSVPPSPAPTTAACKHCGRPLKSARKFCTACGAAA